MKLCMECDQPNDNANHVVCQKCYSVAEVVGGVDLIEAKWYGIEVQECYNCQATLEEAEEFSHWDECKQCASYRKRTGRERPVAVPALEDDSNRVEKPLKQVREENPVLTSFLQEIHERALKFKGTSKLMQAA